MNRLIILYHSRLRPDTRLCRLLSVGLLLVGMATNAQPNGPARAVKLTDHPRILLLNGEEAGIQQRIRADTTWAKIHRAMLTECDHIGTLPVLNRVLEGRRLLSVSREALRRIFFLAYAWRMTRNLAYRQRAEQELLAVCAFSDWNPSHFLDVAEMTMGVAIGYDWLYDDLPASARTTIRDALLTKGIEPSLDPKNNGWLTNTNNWNQVCNAGMSYGALAIYEDRPDLAQSVIDRAVKTIVLPMGEYAPDGAYPEGYGYWGYGTSFNVLFISATEKLFGQDYDLSARLSENARLSGKYDRPDG